ncbi:hypothetical protein RUM43_013365 [Polyplax serrata]|uniref:NADP-dependent oxidoreductase domain-containing protein n=1 Tax=Polyplax serrata TaxID=468196 RepID=A0AAN8P524_POLSC
MPAVGLGTWKSKPEDVTRAVEDAIEAGYRHIDCAFIYQNETSVGLGIKNKINSGIVNRSDLWVTSKLWNTFHRPELVQAALQKSLEQLGLTYLDLYLIHWPQAYREGDDLFPVDETGKTAYSDAHFKNTWKAMEECVNKGLTKSIGVSNFNSQQLADILSICTIKPVVNQIECHPYLNQMKLSEFCRERDVLITAYSPLGSPDRPWAKPGDAQLMDDEKLKQVAQKYNKTVAQVLIRYQVDRGHSVIPKSVTKSRILENFNIFNFKLSEEDMKYINSFDCNGRVCHLDWVKDHILYPFNIEF